MEKFEYKGSCECGESTFTVYEKVTKDNKEAVICPQCRQMIIVSSGEKISLTEKWHPINKEKIKTSEINGLRKK